MSETTIGSGIGIISLQNVGVQELAGGITTLGQTFAQGQLPAGAGLVARIGGSAVPVQVDVKTTWPDGSAKMVVLSVERPDLAAGVAAEVTLAVAEGGPVAGGAGPAALDLATALTGHSFTVDLAIAGRGAPMSIDVLAALREALADGTASFWQRGELATQARVEIAVPDSSMRLVFDVTTFKGGGFQVDAQFNNDRAMEATGGRLDYTAVVRMDGAEVARETLSQAQYQNWHREFSSTETDGGQGTGDPTGGWLNIRQDVAKLGQIGAVADYDLTLRIPETTFINFQNQMAADGWGDPFAANGVTPYMPTAGARGDIGITTMANTAWLISQDPRAAEYALGQAEAASGVTWNFWDAAHETWLNLDHYPHLWVDGRGGTGTPNDPNSPGLTQQRENIDATGWAPEMAHQPDLSFVPYLLTGERWILDNLNAQAAWNLMELWPYPRQSGTGILVNTETGMQVRSAAWAMREIENAAWAAPDGSAEKAYFTNIADTNWKWLVSKIPEWTEQQGEAHGYMPNGSDIISPWQQDYFATTVISAVTRGNQDALTFLNWQKNFLVGRFYAEDKGFNIRDGAAFILDIGDAATGTTYKTWAEIGAATVAAGWSNGDGWEASQGEYARLALSTLAGIYHLTGDVAAAQAYKALVALAPPYTTADAFAAVPNFAVTLPGIYTGSGTTGPGGDDGGGGDGDGDGGDPTPPPPPLPPPPTGDVVATPGNDIVTLAAPVTGKSVDLDAGYDQLTLSSAGPNRLTVSNVEMLQGGSGDDEVVTLGSITQGAPSAGAFIDLGGGNDRLTLAATAPGSVLVSGVEAITGSVADEQVTLRTAAQGARINLGGGEDGLTLADAAENFLQARNVEAIQGGSGADRVYLGTPANNVFVDLGGGADRVALGSTGPNSVTVSHVEIVRGGLAADSIGVASADSAGARMNGGGGADSLTGGEGNDTLIGGAGLDVLTGGAGADRFLIRAAADSPAGTPDVITDFTPGDDLLVLCNLLHGNFAWRGADAFTGGGHTEARFVDASDTLQLDLDGNGAAELVLVLTGVSAGGLAADSFLWA